MKSHSDLWRSPNIVLAAALGVERNSCGTSEEIYERGIHARNRSLARCLGALVCLSDTTVAEAARLLAIPRKTANERKRQWDKQTEDVRSATITRVLAAIVELEATK